MANNNEPFSMPWDLLPALPPFLPIPRVIARFMLEHAPISPLTKI